FERLKDELRAGRTLRNSVERGFWRAWKTILTANVVSFLAAAVLYLFTVGDVKGFAFTLGLSTILNLLMTLLYLRPAVILLGHRRGFTDARLLGVHRDLEERTPVGAGTRSPE
ncbi:MAG: MMPL family transporter, partial [Acidimicrobiales bacterium]